MRDLEFDINAFDDLEWWVRNDRKKALKIMQLLQEIRRNPFDGVGQPERLKYELAGCISRRIDKEHRIVYEVSDNKIRILGCRYHY